MTVHDSAISLQDRCARDARCTGVTTTTDGHPIADQVQAPTPFCGRDVYAIGRALASLPERYVQLRTKIGDKPTIVGEPVSGSREAPIPLRVDVDATIRDMLLVLLSWEERVAAVARLTRPATWLSRRRRDEIALPQAVTTLQSWLELLLCLPAEPMTRILPIRGRAALPAGVAGMVHPHGGYIEATIDLAGAHAGLEVLHLVYKTRQVLGETTPPPVRLDGIPCRGCEALAMQVCPDPHYRSECTECGQLLTADEYADHIRDYTAKARALLCAGEIHPNDPVTYHRIAA